FTEPSNRRIARKCADVLLAHRYQSRCCTHAGRRSSSFHPGVTSANDKHIVMFHVKHPHFPIQYEVKITSRYSSAPILPSNLSREVAVCLIISARSSGGSPSISFRDSLASTSAFTCRSWLTTPAPATRDDSCL